jgi:hypothetical protein
LRLHVLGLRILPRRLLEVKFSVKCVRGGTRS